MIGLQRGDQGPAVQGLQYLLRQAGFDPGPADGDYGPHTAAAVLAMRQSRGSSAQDGNKITGAAYEQLLVSLIKNQAPTPAPAPTPVEGDSMAIKDLPKFGDEGTQVEYYQRLLEAQGVTLNRNRKYDEGMKAAVSQWFETNYGSPYDGSAITAWIALELEQLVLKGEKGDKGDPGEFVGEVRIHGVVDAHTFETE